MSGVKRGIPLQYDQENHKGKWAVMFQLPDEEGDPTAIVLNVAIMGLGYVVVDRVSDVRDALTGTVKALAEMGVSYTLDDCLCFLPVDETGEIPQPWPSDSRIAALKADMERQVRLIAEGQYGITRALRRVDDVRESLAIEEGGLALVKGRVDELSSQYTLMQKELDSLTQKG